MDEEYDVIVLGTGLTVSAASGVQGAASLSPWDAAAPDPILPSVPARHCSVPEKTAPCPTTVMRPPSLSCPVCREAAPFLAVSLDRFPGPDPRPLPRTSLTSPLILRSFWRRCRGTGTSGQVGAGGLARVGFHPASPGSQGARGPRECSRRSRGGDRDHIPATPPRFPMETSGLRRICSLCPWAGDSDW